LDPEKNELSHTRSAETVISKDDSPVRIFVIPTDEEIVMTEDTVALLKGTYDVHTNFTYSFQDKQYTNTMRLTTLQDELKKIPELKSIIATPP
jgi:acetate kinase